MPTRKNMKQLAVGADFATADLEAFMTYPDGVATVTYTNTGAITPESADPAADWDHIWLIPDGGGLPGETYGHTDITDVTGW